MANASRDAATVQESPGDRGQIESVFRLIGLATRLKNQAMNDADLLNRFVTKHDEIAFAGLLERHALLVWNVCRRIHGNVHDAEDSFQATFFVFARKAGMIRSSGALAGWPYRLAYRTAMHAKKTASKRRLREETVAVPAGRTVSGTCGLQELQAVLDEEVQRLAEKYRTPFVLCCLEGKSKSEVAAELGWKEGTVSSRLARARKLLQRRLTRRGIALSAVLTATAVTGSDAAVTVPRALMNATAQAALQFALTENAVLAGSASAATLANEVSKAMLGQKIKVVGVIFLTVAVVWGSAGMVGYGAFGLRSRASRADEKTNDERKPEVSEKRQPRVDLYSEPLPDGAIARMGTTQFRHPVSPENFALSDPEIPVAFSHDGQVLATSWDKQLRLWNATTGKFLLEINSSDPVRAHDFSPDGRFLAAGAAHVTSDEIKSYVCVWDAKTGKLLHRLSPKERVNQIWHILFSPDSKLLAMSDEKGRIYLWDAHTGKEVFVLSPSALSLKHPLENPYACIAFSTDGKTIVTLLHQPRKIWHWDLARREVSKIVSLEILDANKETEEGRTGTYHSYLLSKDAKTLAVGFFGEQAVHLLDTSTGKEFSRIQSDKLENIGRFGLTPDGKFYAAAGWAKSAEPSLMVSVWENKSGKLVRQFQSSSHRLGGLTFSPDGSRMVLGGWYIHLYDVASGKEIASKPAHEGPVTALAFTPDGSTLISAGADSMVGVWDTATGQNRHFIRANRWVLTSVAAIPGSSTFASAGQDGIIRVHDWHTGNEGQRLVFDPDDNGHRPQVKDLKVLPDGRTLLSQVYTNRDSQEPQFHTWDLAMGKLLRSFPKLENADSLDLAGDGKYSLAMKDLTGDRKGKTRPHDRAALEIREISSGRLMFATTEEEPSGIQSIVTADARLLIRDSENGEQPVIRVRELATGKERLCIVVEAEERRRRFYEVMAVSPNRRVLATAGHDHTLQLWDLGTGKELLRRGGFAEPVDTMAFSPNGRFLATGHRDGMIHIWEVSLPHREPPPTAPTANELDSWWHDLAGEDAAKAHAAIWNLAAAPKPAVGLLQERLRPAADKSARIAELIVQLDDAKFAVREAASKELEIFDLEAEPALRRAFDERPSAEKRRRIGRILDRPWMLVHDPEVLREIRAIEILEDIAALRADANGLTALDILKRLAGGAANARQTQDAISALRRLQTQKP
jgi:RNA polymerase sigma factor (sigma-70 family)